MAAGSAGLTGSVFASGVTGLAGSALKGVDETVEAGAGAAGAGAAGAGDTLKGEAAGLAGSALGATGAAGAAAGVACTTLKGEAAAGAGDAGFAAGLSKGFSALGMSTPSGAGMSGFSAFMNGLVFLSCSDVAKSRPLPDLKILSSAGLAWSAGLSLFMVLNTGIASLETSGALAVSTGLSNVPPFLGKTGSFDAGAEALAATGSALGSAGAALGSSAGLSSGFASKGLNAEMEESNSKSSNSSLKGSLNVSV